MTPQLAIGVSVTRKPRERRGNRPRSVYRSPSNGAILEAHYSSSGARRGEALLDKLGAGLFLLTQRGANRVSD